LILLSAIVSAALPVVAFLALQLLKNYFNPELQKRRHNQRVDTAIARGDVDAVNRLLRERL
jgi:hypothetical protein